MEEPCSHEPQLQSPALGLGLPAQPGAASPASTAAGAPARSPYLLRDLVKVEELEMLYAEFCLGTRATEEPSVTWGQRWREQVVTLREYRRSSPAAGRKQTGGMKLHSTPGQGHPSPPEETYIPTSAWSREGSGETLLCLSVLKRG